MAKPKKIYPFPVEIDKMADEDRRLMRECLRVLNDATIEDDEFDAAMLTLIEVVTNPPLEVHEMDMSATTLRAKPSPGRGIIRGLSSLRDALRNGERLGTRFKVIHRKLQNDRYP